MKILKDVLKRNLAAIAVWAVISLLNLAVFILYDIMAEPLIYTCVLSFVLLAAVIVSGCVRESARAKKRGAMISSAESGRIEMPEAETAAEEDYQAVIALLEKRTEQLADRFTSEKMADMDYYTAWVHQIKTPIAVMKLKLSDDTERSRALSSQLLRIEQYADMVLQYIRLGSGSTDLVIAEYSLDELIRETVRKFAPLFVEKKLRLDFRETGRRIITDRKWFCCIIEQFLSNAVKYTPEGTVSVFAQGDSLVIADTGIGIAAEDLPRIFEMGYTGNNGRTGRQSSGLGLYLAKKAANMLSLPLSVESTVGQGTRFIIGLDRLQETGTGGSL